LGFPFCPPPPPPKVIFILLSEELVWLWYMACANSWTELKTLVRAPKSIDNAVAETWDMNTYGIQLLQSEGTWYIAPDGRETVLLAGSIAGH
jgi:hypothetical protein